MHRLFLIITAGFFLLYSNGCYHYPMNLDISKKELITYYEAGKYREDLDNIYSKFSKSLPPADTAKKEAVIFDVDETTLNNYLFIKSISFGYEEKMWREWLLSGKCPRIEQSFNFYKLLLAKGYRVIFLTGRDEIYTDATNRNLTEQGYTTYDTLITRAKAEKQIPASAFKNQVRARLTAAGYSIKYCIGDQESDLTGENTGTCILLPNYIYAVL